MQTDISIIIPTLNREEKLNIAINSILNQSIKNYEIIIINDGGKYLQFNSDKINCINLKINQGRANARNIGLKNSNGKYICFLDDDDFFYPNHLEILYGFLEENSNYFGAYTGSHIFIDNKKIDFLSVKYDYNSLLVKGYIPILSAMFRNNKNIYFNKKLLSNEDWDFWIRLLKNKKFMYIDKITNIFYHNKKEKDFIDFSKTRFYIYKKYKSKENFLLVELEKIKLLQNTEFYNPYLEHIAKYMYKKNLKNELINLFFTSLKFNFRDNKDISKIIIEAIKDLGDIDTYNLLVKKIL